MNIKQYTGTLNNCEFKKEGITNNRSWKKYLLTFEDGFRATDFNTIYGECIGKVITINVENKPWKGDDSKMRDSWTVVSARPQRRTQQDAPQNDKKLNEIISALNDLSAQIAAMDVRLMELVPNPPKADNPSSPVPF